jgi:flagellar biosynthesis/type III secretory pathway M-ring protein FliF/YscJ
MVVLPIASAAGVAATVAVVLFVVLATTWIPLKMRRERRRGENLIQQDAERGDLAAEVEQMRRVQAGESGDADKS